MSNAALQNEEQVSRAEHEEVLRQLAASQAENERLIQLVINLKKGLFGKKSEKLPLNQLCMFEEPKLPVAEPEKQEFEIPAHTRRKSTGRKPLPADLPRERKEYFPEEKFCPCCNKELVRIGEEVTEELDYVPAQLVVKEHVKVKLACSYCKNGVQTAKLPPEVQPIERGRPGVGLLVYIIISKFCDHLPLHRLEKMFARDGVSIAKQRMWDWIEAIADQLKSLHRALLVEILLNDYVQADETTILVQSRGEGTYTGYYWAVHSPPNLVYYRYAPTRASSIPLEIFAGFKGYIQTDLYAGYNVVYLPENVTRLGCLAHVRRKFLEKNAASNPKANSIVAQIAQLYGIEKQAKSLSVEERALVRREKSLPLLEKLFTKIEQLHQELLPRNPLREATEYALKQKEELMRYVERGDFQIDNNAIERQMRPIAVGRKNYMFAGSDSGAEAASIFYSLINSCKLNKINPRDYLADVIRRLPTHPVANIAELLPHNWKPLQK